MAVRSRGAASATPHAYADFVDRSRTLVRGCALLVLADPRRADRLTESVLARRLADLSRPPAGGPTGTATDPLLVTLAEVVHPRPTFFDPPWADGTRVELRDAGPVSVAPVVVELQRVAVEQRAALVLGQFALLDAAAVAAVLRTDVATVELWVQQAYAVLAAGRPDRLRPGVVAEELRAAVDAHVGRSAPLGPAALDLAHGRQLVRGRRVRRASALVAAVLVLVLGSVLVVQRGSGVPDAGLDPVAPTAPASPSPDRHPDTVRATCDIKNPSCQATVMRDWRGEMAKVTASHVDPRKAYLSGYSFSFDERYESTSFWSGRGGALGLDLFRLEGGATHIYLQIATSYGRAVPCGRTTEQTCESMRFMDGNRFTLSSSTQVSDGIEVQYRPDGDQVITVVARNTNGGRVLNVTRGDLIELVQDPRLRLPEF